MWRQLDLFVTEEPDTVAIGVNQRHLEAPLTVSPRRRAAVFAMAKLINDQMRTGRLQIGKTFSGEESRQGSALVDRPSVEGLRHG
jgi:hypothetical protein